jgi:hypothetical protein
MVALFLNFLGDLHTALHSGCTNLCPTNSVEVFFSTYILPAFVDICVIDDSHYDWGESPIFPLLKNNLVSLGLDAGSLSTKLPTN